MKILNNPQGNDPQINAGESGVGGFAGFIAIMTDNRYKNLIKHLNPNEHTNILFVNTEGANDHV